MLALLQRVQQARVEVDGHTIGQIDAGLLVLICAERGDTEAIADKLLAKILKLRIFADEAGKMNRSVQDVNGGLLIVSQFTLAADTSGGNRPGFGNAAPLDEGAGSMTISWRRPVPCIRSCRPGSSRLTCRCFWSMTGR